MAARKQVRQDRFSYLLRGWKASGSSGRDPPIWRFSLDDPSTEERLGFGSFEELVAFIEMLLTDRNTDTQN